MCICRSGQLLALFTPPLGDAIHLEHELNKGCQLLESTPSDVCMHQMIRPEVQTHHLRMFHPPPNTCDIANVLLLPDSGKLKHPVETSQILDSFPRNLSPSLTTMANVSTSQQGPITRQPTALILSRFVALSPCHVQFACVWRLTYCLRGD